MDKKKVTREAFSLKRKFDIIQKLKAGTTQAELSRQEGIKRKTINTIWLQRTNIEADFVQKSSTQKRKRGLTFQRLDDSLWEWFNGQRSCNNPLSGPILLEKARQFAKELNLETFKASNGWLEKWKKRHDVTWRSISGEAAAVDKNVVSTWMADKWPTIAAEFRPEDIYNCDETGLFWRMLPDKSLAVKNERCVGGKMSKERLTVLLCSNQTGSDKMTPLVIGKSQNPRAFKRLRCRESLPVQYKANSKAWMTTLMFTEWLTEFDKKMMAKKRKIALILDNCPSHPKVVKLSNIRLVYLPPNTTSVTQPLDQGIIQNFKVKYRGALLRRTISAMEQKLDSKIDVLDAILMLSNAWNQVEASTVANCFRKTGFSTSLDVEFSEPQENVLESLLSYASQLDYDVDMDELSDAFLNSDFGVITSEVPSDEEIIRNVEARNVNETVDAFDEEGDEIEQSETTQPEPDVTSLEALAALRVVQRYFMQQTAPSSVQLQQLICMEEFVFRNQEAKKRQTSLTDYFAPQQQN